MNSTGDGRREFGVVQNFDPIKCFGFIRPDHGAQDFFVHAEALVGAANLKPGDRVLFQPTDGNRGPRAVNVVRV
jgi:cold shock CspA family protein